MSTTRTNDQKVFDAKSNALLSRCLEPHNQANAAIVFAGMLPLLALLTSIASPRGQTPLPMLYALLPLVKTLALTGFVFADDDFLIINNVNYIMFARPGTLKSPTLLLIKGIVNVGSLNILFLGTLLTCWL